MMDNGHFVPLRYRRICRVLRYSCYVERGGAYEIDIVKALVRGLRIGKGCTMLVQFLGQVDILRIHEKG